MKELPKRGDKVRLGKSVCVVLSKQGNDFIARNDEGNLVGFDKHSPFTIVERKQEQKSEAEEAISSTKEIASAEGELEKADEVTDSSSALSKEGDTSKEEPKKENVSGIMDLLFGLKKKKED